MCKLATCRRIHFTFIKNCSLNISLDSLFVSKLRMNEQKKMMLILLKSVSNLWGWLIHSAYACGFKQLCSFKNPGLTLTSTISVQILWWGCPCLSLVPFKGEICPTWWLYGVNQEITVILRRKLCNQMKRWKTCNLFTPKIIFFQRFDCRSSRSYNFTPSFGAPNLGSKQQHKSQYGFCYCFSLVQKERFAVWENDYTTARTEKCLSRFPIGHYWNDSAYLPINNKWSISEYGNEFLKVNYEELMYFLYIIEIISNIVWCSVSSKFFPKRSFCLSKI